MQRKHPFLEQFARPHNHYRVKPFWFWNAELDQNRIRQQIEDFAAMGLGGFFIHARFGIAAADYLSDNWFSAVDTALQTAEKLGMDVWIYDENLFPSGIGNNVVSRQQEYAPKFIECRVIAPDDLIILDDGRLAWPNDLAASASIFAAQIISDGTSPIKLDFSVSSGQVVFADADHQEIKLFYTNTLYGQNKNIYGVDYLSPSIIPAFINSTHAIYKEKVGRWFGGVIKGFFTDEPALLPWHHDLSWYKDRTDGLCLPYTGRLLERINQDQSENIALDELTAALFYDGPDPARTSQLRQAYWQTVSRLYRDNFFVPYARWCEENGLMLTGHVLLEEGLYFNHIFQAGPIDGLSAMHIPGVDQLTKSAENDSMAYMVGNLDHVPEVRTNVTGIKLVSSLAHTAGRRQILSETFGVGGWDLQLSQMKPLIDWQAILGVNRFCPHAFFYSIEGFRKFDAPPCHYRNYPLQHYRLFADYTARISLIMSEGSPCADTAVLYPASAFRSSYAVGRQRYADQVISDLYDWTCVALLRNHYHYEILTEDLLEKTWIEQDCLRLPDIVPGRIAGVDSDTAQLKFNNLIIPSAEGLAPAARSVLESFAAAGGRLIILDQKLTGQSKKDSENALDYAIVEQLLLADLNGRRMVGLTLSGQGAKDVYTSCRKADHGWIHFLANTSRNNSFSGTAGGLTETALRLDPESGLYESLLQSQPLTLLPAQSLIIWQPEEAAEAPLYTPKRLTGAVILPMNEWNFQLSGQNALPLDDWRFKLRSGGMGMQYTYTADILSQTDLEHLTLAFDDIESRTAIMGKMDVKVSCNDQPCPKQGWDDDHLYYNFRIAKISAGHNTIKVIINHSAWSGQPHILNSRVLLRGDFTVLSQDGRLVLSRPRHKLDFADWSGQGYPFYSGCASFDKSITLPDQASLVLQIQNINGSARVLLNDQDLGSRAWSPWMWPIPDDFAGQTVRLTIEFSTTLASEFGQVCQSGPAGSLSIDSLIGV